MLVREQVGRPVPSSAEAARILRAILAAEDHIDQAKEHFWVIGLDAKNVVQYVDLVTLGTLSSSPVHPREVFRTAIYQGVAHILCGHNHPSGDLTPSSDDIDMATRLRDAGQLLGIEMLDFIVVAESDNYYSAREHGVI